MKFQRPHATPDGPALRYRDGRYSELHAFLGDALVFDGDVPKVWHPLPLFEQIIVPGVLIVHTTEGFEVRP